MDDSVNQFKASSDFKDDRGGANLYPHPIVGIVKHNIDGSRTGQIRVLLKRMNGAYPEDIPANWSKPISYMSPFFGYTPNESGKNDYGSFAGNPHSYGMWMTPPDLGTEVLCIFANGDPNFGYYIGCLPKPGLNHMVPAIGAEDNIILNQGEAQSYGGATRLPVGEINNANDKQANSGTLSKQPRPVHSYQAAIYNKQGLLRDKDRGPISSSAQRESPSRVFGISTPGRPIYAGGFTDDNIKSAIKNTSIPDKSLEVVGRVGGHTFVMDDGDVEGHDQLVRLRTASGHTILMNDAAQTLFIMHANGQSYIELGKEGTIDMYATNSVNIRSQGDLNLHSDRDININANRDLNIMGVNTHIESQQNTTFFTGKTMNTTVLGNHTEKVGGTFSLLADTSVGIRAAIGATFINGTTVNLNSGMCPAFPMPAAQLPRTLHTDTLYDSKVGYAPAPQKLSSIVSRAPAHAPWAAANKGVDVKTDLSASGSSPAPASSAINQLNASVSPSPTETTNPSLMSTVPTTAAVSSSSIEPATASAMASQMAVTAATGPGGAAVQASAGVLETGTGLKASVGLFGVTPTQMVSDGILKPGADIAANAGIASGLGLHAAMPPNMFTGKDGINSVGDLVKNIPAQTNIAVNSLNNAKDTLTSLGAISGKESLTQTGGLIMAAAVAGPQQAIAYAQNQINGAINSTLNNLTPDGIKNIGTNLSTTFDNISTNISDTVTGLQDKFNSIADGSAFADLGSSLDNLMSGGLFASISVEEQLNTSLVDTVIKTIQGAATAAFAQVISAFSALPADVPISLAAANEGNSALLAVNESLGIGETLNKSLVLGDSGVTGIMDAAKSSAVNSVSTDSAFTLKNAVGGSFEVASATVPKVVENDIVMGGVPGGLSSVSNVTQAGQTDLTQIPGVGPVASAVSNGSSSMNSTPGSSFGSVATSILAAGSLVNLVSSGLSQLGFSQLSGALGSLGIPGGPFQTKLPTMASDATNFAGIQAQTANLLNDAKSSFKIPPLNFKGKEAKTDAETVAENTKNTQIQQATEAQDRAFELWHSNVAKYGENSPEAQSSYAEYVDKRSYQETLLG